MKSSKHGKIVPPDVGAVFAVIKYGLTFKETEACRKLLGLEEGGDVYGGIERLIRENDALREENEGLRRGIAVKEGS